MNQLEVEVNHRVYMENKFRSGIKYVCGDLEREIGFEYAIETNVREYLQRRELDEDLVEVISKTFMDESQRRAQQSTKGVQEQARKKWTVNREGTKLHFKYVDT